MQHHCLSSSRADRAVGHCAQLPPLPGKRHKWSKPRPYLVRCGPVTKFKGCRPGFHHGMPHNRHDITLVAVLTDVSTASCCGLPLNKVYRLFMTIFMGAQEAAPDTQPAGKLLTAPPHVSSQDVDNNGYT